MKINEIKINGYGKLKNKEYKFEDGINVIKGENESGKSTILSYIINILYGPSRNKEGKDISDFEKYKPWVGEEYSGKISYLLDDGNNYEVFREFSKKNPKIFNRNMEDITSKFGTDKKEGSTFFIDQTNVDKTMFLSTIVAMQQEVRLNTKDQNILIQKIANIAGSGDDKISYKKANEKLQNMIKDKIGTSRTSQKPLNILQNKIQELDEKIEDISKYENRKYEIGNEKESLKQELDLKTSKKEILLKLKETEEKSQSLNQQIEMINKNIDENNDIVEENNKKIQAIEEKKSEIEKEQREIELNLQKYNEEIQRFEKEKSTKGKQKVEKVDLKTIFAVVICAIIIAVGFIINKKIISIIGGAVLLILVLIFSLLKIRKSKTNNINIDREIEKLNAKISSEKAELESKNYNQNESIKEISALKGQVSLLKETNSKLGSQAKEIKEKIDEKRVEENDSSIDVSGLDDLNSQIKQIEDEIYEIKNNINKIETEELYILPQLDELVSLREEKFDCEEKLKELKEEEEIINIAIETLEAAYEEMKTSITPKFTKKLSENINKISNGKYFNVTINDESGMIVETESGNYIDIDKLSVGTIDALYFALRLSMIEDLSEEKMPILLDETFAYFDNNRLEAALRYLIENQSDHQVVLFTCSDREIEILNKMREEYNLIEL